MTKELEDQLIERWGRWFNIHGDVSETAMQDGFACEDGWFGILWRLFEDLERLVREAEEETGRGFEILQVKEKLGSLRVITNFSTVAICERIEGAKAEALAIGFETHS